ncbi:MAG: hypothetical protein VCB26_03770 [Candidatus Hydrogenedentota bacterium]
MSACEEYEGLVAQSLYETLTEVETTDLSAHLAGCEGCSAERESLSLLKEFIPVEAVVFQGDLRPVLEERVRTETRGGWISRLVFSGAAGVIVMGAVIFQFLESPLDDMTGPITPQTASERYFASILGQTAELIEEDQYPQAYIVLRKSIDGAEAESVPADVRILLAEIAYERLRWYPEAYTAYDQLRLAEPTVYRNSEEFIRRYAVLDEARSLNSEYTSLHTWDRVVLEEDVEALSIYITEYPGTIQASEAVHEMARVLSASAEYAGESVDSVLETALKSNDDPIVVAQIKLELGRYYWKNVKDADKARMLFEDVEESTVTVLASAASQSLRALRSE